jgi:hypothetical protein
MIFCWEWHRQKLVKFTFCLIISATHKSYAYTYAISLLFNGKGVNIKCNHYKITCAYVIVTHYCPQSSSGILQSFV